MSVPRINQPMFDWPQYGPWMVTHKGDRSCRQLADRHYSRQTPGADMFCRPGRNLVLRTPLGDAVWVTWSGIRDDGLDAWECTIFRNESDLLSSSMIQAAVAATIDRWGALPADGLITYVDAGKVRSVKPWLLLQVGGLAADWHEQEARTYSFAVAEGPRSDRIRLGAAGGRNHPHTPHNGGNVMKRLKFEMWPYRDKPDAEVNGYMSRFTDGTGLYTDSWWCSPPASIDHVGPEYLPQKYRHPNVRNNRHMDFIKRRFKMEMSRLRPNTNA